MPHEMLTRETQQCIRECCECASICTQTSFHCLHLGGPHASPDHQSLLRDCAQICGVAVGFMARSSHYAADICRECTEICTACANECDRMANGDQLMKQCAQVCRKCAQTCERMAAAGVA